MPMPMLSLVLRVFAFLGETRVVQAVDLKCERGCRYEPWWIGARSQVAPFDVRYRGFGKDKVQQLKAQQMVLGSRCA